MHCSRHWAHDIWHAKNVSTWGIEFLFQHVNLLTFKIKKLCRNLWRSQILGHQIHVHELKTIAVTERCELRDVNTHTYSRVRSDIFLLKSTVSTDDDSPPVFRWNVKHTRVVLFAIKLICSLSLFSYVQMAFQSTVTSTSHPDVSVLIAAVSQPARLC